MIIYSTRNIFKWNLAVIARFSNRQCISIFLRWFYMEVNTFWLHIQLLAKGTFPILLWIFEFLNIWWRHLALPKIFSQLIKEEEVRKTAVNIQVIWTKTSMVFKHAAYVCCLRRVFLLHSVLAAGVWLWGAFRCAGSTSNPNGRDFWKVAW